MTRNALVEANPLSSGIYHIEIVGDNGLALLAYRSDIQNIGENTYWEGTATVGALGMAFQQECRSICSADIQAKQWRGKWVHSNNTSPKEQLQIWLQDCLRGDGTYNTTAIPAVSVLPLENNDTRTVTSLHLPDAKLNWNALCDVHLDSMFGTQAFLTDVEEGAVTLYFDAATNVFIGAIFSAQKGQTTISGVLTMSATDEQPQDFLPTVETLSDETKMLYEEWDLLGA